MNWQSEFERIPGLAKVLAVVAFVALAAAMSLLLNGRGIAGVGTLSGAIVGTLVASYILLAGYVYADARRREMPAGAWTALAVLVPNCLGFVLYFLLRKPLVHPCPHCGNGVPPDAAYCPRCGQPQQLTAA